MKINKNLRSAIRLNDKQKVKEVLLNEYSYSNIVESLAEYLTTPKVKITPVVNRFKISKEQFDKYFEIAEKRLYKKKA